MRARWVIGAACVVVLGTPFSANAADAGKTTRVSIGPGGGDADASSTRAVVSNNGKVVVFESRAHDLIPHDPRPAGSDVYWVRRSDPAASMRKVSTATTDNGRANGNSHLPSVSGNGRYVAYASDATNLTTEAGGGGGIYRWDATTGRTKPVTVTIDGADPSPGYSARPTISANGRYVEFYSQACNLVAGVCPAANVGNLYVRDMATGKTRVVTRSERGGEPDADTARGELSADGSYVVFESAAANLVAGDSNGVIDIFGVPLVRGVPGKTKRLSVSATGGEPNAASGRPTLDDTGRYVAYESWASNLVADDTNGKLDAFVVRTATLDTTRVSVSANGGQLYVPTSRPALSGDGRIVAFVTGGPAVNGDTNHSRDVYLRDWATATPTNVLASVPSPVAGDCSSGGGVDIATRPSLAGGLGFGRPLVLAFVSSYCNLVRGDTNGVADVFTRVWTHSPF